MRPPPPESVTALLQAWSQGDSEAGDRLMPLVYKELRRRAARYLRRERPGHTLQPTALVHEAYLKLVGHNLPWRNRSHFFGVASNLMRQVLVDHARRRRTAKREGVRVVLDDALDASAARGVDVVDLDEALTELSALDPRQGRIVELRFFGGLTLEETAKTLRISPATVKRDWRVAKAWLFRRMERRPAPIADSERRDT
jgi:RNA polymerase sigma factor (TIGR02999 family)